ncbi:NAD-dependent DNA ligase LigA [Candidatus Profftella armatura (Diaphorina cf. continua)]|uniref:DNA ligase n=1 Tax=Candidatus Profftella armatura (Diaphorina cf. continua) TaxID=2661583 RepID=A0A7R6VYX1_9PROT|nr:NAD-dependent DNA ligase LigA [Candidatus Profftella armatura (Diaphorina cf. continua)]BCG49581.1 NAD-dependent DNA ligase LigA [Candidatus Profftella armatura (Diaphorina cf. continua)]
MNFHTKKKINFSKLSLRVAKLKKELHRHNIAYYLHDNPIISDNKYDQLFFELKKIEEKYPELLTKDSLTQHVGGRIFSNLKHVHHSFKMMSLDNGFSDEDIIMFDKRITNELKLTKNIEYIAELKFDGIAVNLRYEYGYLKQASTRGDGNIGENITNNICTIHKIPLVLNIQNPPELLEVRCEVLIYKKDFKKLNQYRYNLGLKEFTNPRNAAAGSLRQLNPKITKNRILHFFAHGIGELRGMKMPSSHSTLLNWYQKIGLSVCTEYSVLLGVNKLLEFYKKINIKRFDLPYEIDGVVYKINCLSTQKKLGFTSRAPRFALAYKFLSKKALTKIKAINIQIGRTGIITPVALLKPVLIDGITITRATLHNESEIYRKNIQIGDTVIIHRSGNVIPKIISSILSLRPNNSKIFKIPDICPVCNSKIIYIKSNSIARCSGSWIKCIAQRKAGLQHFASRKAMNIIGLGKKIIEKLVDINIIITAADLYKINLKDLLKLDHISNKLANNILLAIQQSKLTTFSRFIYALGIRHVGEIAAKKLANHFKNLEFMLKATEVQLLNIPKIGSTTIKALIKFINQPLHRLLISQLCDAGIYWLENSATKDQKKYLKGKIFVFTGSLYVFKRNEAITLIENLGGKVVNFISKNTDYLVKGQKPGKKIEKAIKLNIKILNEKNFSKILKNNS